MEERSHELAKMLEDLREQAGLSYNLLSRKAGIPQTTVHRYCKGESLPDSEQTRKLGHALGATQEQQEDLDKRRRKDKGIAEIQTTPQPITAPPLEPAQVAVPSYRRWVRAAAGAAILGVGLAVVLGGLLPRKPSADLSLPPPWQAAYPDRIDPAFFGVTMNSGSGHMPDFTVGALRLWDSATQWSRIQPTSRDSWDWSTLDRLVISAGKIGKPVLYTFGATPAWANPHGLPATYLNSRSTPPLNLDDWDHFVSTLVARYKGRISAYELWVMLGDPRNYSGSVSTMVEMVRRAHDIIHGADPAARIVCPSMGQLWKPEGIEALTEFARLNGYDYCDYMGVKLYQPQASDPPETMLRMVQTIQNTFYKLSVNQLPTWSTGTTNDITQQTPLEPVMAADYAARFYLVGLYARYGRMYFYNWGGTKIPIVLQPDGGPKTLAATYVEQLEAWLDGARIAGCGAGSADGLPDNVYRCRFILPPQRGGNAAILWTSTGAATVPIGKNSLVRHLDAGGTSDLTAGQEVSVTGSPVLVQDR